MLVLTRKEGEKVHIGDDIVVMVVRVFGDNVRLGILAPKNVQVHREEVLREIQRQKAKDLSNQFHKNPKSE